jgi:hypothetical protein
MLLRSLWFFGAALASQHAARTIMATGTPFNNREQDLATLCAIIDP